MLSVNENAIFFNSLVYFTAVLKRFGGILKMQITMSFF
jgi:hypothetical protein